MGLRLHEMRRPHDHACDAESVLSVAVYTQMYGEINQDHQGIIDETLFSASSIDQNAVHPTVLIPLPPCFTCISITDFYGTIHRVLCQSVWILRQLEYQRIFMICDFCVLCMFPCNSLLFCVDLCTWIIVVGIH